MAYDEDAVGLEQFLEAAVEFEKDAFFRDLLHSDARIDGYTQSVQLNGVHTPSLLAGRHGHAATRFDDMYAVSLFGQISSEFQADQLGTDDHDLLSQGAILRRVS